MIRWQAARGEEGSAALVGAVAAAILLLSFTGATNVAVDEYAKGAFRTAVEEAAQSGAAAGGSVAACESEAAQVRRNLLPGGFAGDIEVGCVLEGAAVVAVATGTLPTFVPVVPPLHISVQAFSLVDRGGQP